MKTLMIDKANNLLDFTEQTGVRPHLEHIHFTETYAEAGDGRIIIRSDYPIGGSPGNFLPGEFTPGTLVNAAVIDRAFRNVCPMKEATHNRRFTGMTEVEKTCLHLSDGPEGTVSVHSFQPNNVVSQSNTVPYRKQPFPNTERVIPDTTPTVEVTIAVPLLLKILNHAKKCGASCVTLGVRDALQPVGFRIPIKDGRTMRGLVMPLRTDHTDAIVTPYNPPPQAPEPTPVSPPSEVPTSTDRKEVSNANQ